MATGRASKWNKPFINVPSLPRAEDDRRASSKTVEDRVCHQAFAVEYIHPKQCGYIGLDNFEVHKYVRNPRCSPKRQLDYAHGRERLINEPESTCALSYVAVVYPQFR